MVRPLSGLLLSVWLGALLVAGGTAGAPTARVDAIGHDPVGDLHRFGTYSPWEFLDIVAFGATSGKRGLEGFLQFVDPPLQCPRCTFRITFTTGRRKLIVEIETAFTRILRRELLRSGSDGSDRSRARILTMRFPVWESGSRLWFDVPVQVARGTVMRAESFHDEGEPGGGRAFDLTDTPLVLGGTSR